MMLIGTEGTGSAVLITPRPTFFLPIFPAGNSRSPNSVDAIQCTYLDCISAIDRAFSVPLGRPLFLSRRQSKAIRFIRRSIISPYSCIAVKL